MPTVSRERLPDIYIGDLEDRLTRVKFRLGRYGGVFLEKIAKAFIYSVFHDRFEEGGVSFKKWAPLSPMWKLQRMKEGTLRGGQNILRRYGTLEQSYMGKGPRSIFDLKKKRQTLQMGTGLKKAVPLHFGADASRKELFGGVADFERGSWPRGKKALPPRPVAFMLGAEVLDLSDRYFAAFNDEIRKGFRGT